VADLPNLETLDLMDNPIRTPPPEIAARGIGAIREYFAQLAESGEDYLFEAKLLILGEGGAGKTSLAAKLIDPQYALQPDEVSTEGIAVRQWNFSTKDKKSFTVNIWDFGGQEIYHATHQFFLTKRSLYLLVADSRKEDTDFYYWLKVIELLGGNSPILIIKNEKQDRHREIDQRALKASFESLQQVRVVNLATNRGLSDAIREIQKYITELPHIGTPLPSKWVKVRQALEAHPENYIDMEEYRRICMEYGFSSSDDACRLSEYLHDLGVCLHFQQDPLLKKILILKPKWGTDAVYRVLDNKEIMAAYGRFKRRDLSSIWQEPQYENMRDELLQLMLNFKLCYKIPGTDDTYMAPQLLDVNQPTYPWNKLPQLMLRYEYDFLPKGILTQLIVSMHTLIERSTCVWRSGVVLHRAGARAEVIERYQERQIRVAVQGDNRKELLTIVAYELDRVHSAFKDLRFRMMIPCNCRRCTVGESPNFYSFKTIIKFRLDNQRYIQCQNSYEMVDVKELVDDVLDAPYDPRKEQATQPSLVIAGSVQNVIIGSQETRMEKRESSARPVVSAWANGSFYLFVVVIVFATLCVVANTISLAALAAILIAGIVVVPMVGALQLRQDDRLSERPFMELMKLSFQQLPLIRRAGKPAKVSEE
jgi:GTPase SAR1 family protein